MQLLSYNPEDDEFFVGMSLEELEQIPEECNIDYGYNSNYENVIKNGLEKYKDEKYNELIRELYQCDKIPFICVVTDRDFYKVSIRPKHFPFAPLWNGYSPWKNIFVREIEPFNPIRIKIEYMYFNDILSSFCDEWIERFSDKNSNCYQLTEDLSFANYCKSFGWIVDNGESFMERYSCNSYDEALDYLPKVTDINLLGNLVFSYWRYFNHWAYSSKEIMNNKYWFVKTLTRLKQLL